jgi:L-aminopeptidase/D-esterase-like protein
VRSQLPEGFLAGHWTDRNAWTGCTAIVAPEATVASCEVRGGGPGTRETDLLGPGSAIPGVDAVILSGGSAFGLSAADGVSRWLEENDRGFETAAARIPLVGSAIVYDLALGSSTVRPTADAGFRACENAQPSIEGGSVGAGTGCTVGKLLGAAHWTKGGLGYSVRASSDGVTVGAIAVANAFGDVLDESGKILAGIWRDGYVRTVDLLAGGHRHTRADREATTLVCIVTDAALTKTQAWTVARAGSAGVARAVDPAATTVDGDVVFCLASGVVPADPLTVAVVAADVTSAAIRDGVRRAGGAPGCPAASERAGTA